MVMHNECIIHILIRKKKITLFDYSYRDLKNINVTYYIQFKFKFNYIIQKSKFMISTIYFTLSALFL